MSGCLDVWMSGCLDVWMCGCVDVCMCGCLAVWMSGCLDVSMSRCLDVCVWMGMRIASTHLSSVLTFSRRRSVWIVFVYASRLLMSLLAIPPETQVVFRRKLIRQSHAGLCESDAGEGHGQLSRYRVERANRTSVAYVRALELFLKEPVLQW